MGLLLVKNLGQFLCPGFPPYVPPNPIPGFILIAADLQNIQTLMEREE